MREITFLSMCKFFMETKGTATTPHGSVDQYYYTSLSLLLCTVVTSVGRLAAVRKRHRHIWTFSSSAARGSCLTTNISPRWKCLYNHSLPGPDKLLLSSYIDIILRTIVLLQTGEIQSKNHRCIQTSQLVSCNRRSYSSAGIAPMKSSSRPSNTLWYNY